MSLRVPGLAPPSLAPPWWWWLAVGLAAGFLLWLTPRIDIAQQSAGPRPARRR